MKRIVLINGSHRFEYAKGGFHSNGSIEHDNEDSGYIMSCSSLMSCGGVTFEGSPSAMGCIGFEL
jgi:hypothetical protein